MKYVISVTLCVNYSRMRNMHYYMLILRLFQKVQFKCKLLCRFRKFFLFHFLFLKGLILSQKTSSFWFCLWVISIYSFIGKYFFHKSTIICFACYKRAFWCKLYAIFFISCFSTSSSYMVIPMPRIISSWIFFIAKIPLLYAYSCILLKNIILA